MAFPSQRTTCTTLPVASSISATRRARVHRLRRRFPSDCRSGGAAARSSRDCAAPPRLPPVRRFAVAQLKTSRCDSPRCRVVPVVFPENWKRRPSISLSARKWLQKSGMKHMFVTVNNETFVAPYSNDSSGAQLGKRPDLRRAFSEVVSVFIYQRPDPKLNPMLGPPS